MLSPTSARLKKKKNQKCPSELVTAFDVPYDMLKGIFDMESGPMRNLLIYRARLDDVTSSPRHN